jgi:hypothetical protein
MGDVTKDAVSRVRDAFVAAGWTVDGVLDLLGAAGWAALGRDERVPAAHALRQDADAAATPAGLLTRLFLLREPVPQAEGAAALPWTPMHGLGLVDLHGDQAVAALDVRPYGETDVDWYVVSDLDDRRLRAGPCARGRRGLAHPGRSGAAPASAHRGRPGHRLRRAGACT